MTDPSLQDRLERAVELLRASREVPSRWPEAREAMRALAALAPAWQEALLDVERALDYGELSLDDAIAKLNALAPSPDQTAASDALFGMFDDLDDSLFGMFDALDGFAPLDVPSSSQPEPHELLEPMEDDDSLELPIFSSGLATDASRASGVEPLEEVDPFAQAALPQVPARDDAMAIMEELEALEGVGALGELEEVGALGELEEVGELDELQAPAAFDALSVMGGLEALSELSDSVDMDEGLEPFEPGALWGDEVSSSAPPQQAQELAQEAAPAPRLKLGPLSSWLPAPTAISPRSGQSSPHITLPLPGHTPAPEVVASPQAPAPSRAELPQAAQPFTLPQPTPVPEPRAEHIFSGMDDLFEDDSPDGAAPLPWRSPEPVATHHSDASLFGALDLEDPPERAPSASDDAPRVSLEVTEAHEDALRFDLPELPYAVEGAALERDEEGQRADAALRSDRALFSDNDLFADDEIWSTPEQDLFPGELPDFDLGEGASQGPSASQDDSQPQDDATVLPGVNFSIPEAARKPQTEIHTIEHDYEGEEAAEQEQGADEDEPASPTTSLGESMISQMLDDELPVSVRASRPGVRTSTSIAQPPAPAPQAEADEDEDELGFDLDFGFGGPRIEEPKTTSSPFTIPQAAAPPAQAKVDADEDELGFDLDFGFGGPRIEQPSATEAHARQTSPAGERAVTARQESPHELGGLAPLSSAPSAPPERRALSFDFDFDDDEPLQAQVREVASRAPATTRQAEQRVDTLGFEGPRVIDPTRLFDRQKTPTNRPEPEILQQLAQPEPGRDENITDAEFFELAESIATEQSSSAQARYRGEPMRPPELSAGARGLGRDRSGLLRPGAVGRDNPFAHDAPTGVREHPELEPQHAALLDESQAPFLKPRPQTPQRADEDSLQAARREFEAGRFGAASAVVTRLLTRDPADAGARQLQGAIQNEQERVQLRRLGSLSRTPKLAVAPSALSKLNLDHRAGFLLSQADGMMTFEDIIEVCGMPRLEAVTLLADLLEGGVLRL